ncbi:MAG: VOC family protein [Acidimicrobiia bacterium]
MSHKLQVTFDAADPAALADFWVAALGYVLQPPPEGFASWPDWLREMGIPEESWNDAAAVVDPDGEGPRLFFQRVPEGKTAKNRVHIDVGVSGGHSVGYDERVAVVDGHVATLVGLGASQLEMFSERGEYWVVMQDPEGNEFCVQ